MSEVILEGCDLVRVLPGPTPTTLIDHIDIALTAGQFLAITGPSGSGKSSLLYLLGLLDAPSEGDVLVSGRSTARLPEEERAAMRLATLGFVFQFHFLLPEFSAMENVMLPMRALGRLKRRAMTDRAGELLAALGLADHRFKTPDRMSGGQRQRVAIARALANEPKVILADEPTGNLDTASTEQVFTLMRTLSESQGTALVVVTHDLGLAERADRRAHLVDGRIVEFTDARPRPATDSGLLPLRPPAAQLDAPARGL